MTMKEALMQDGTLLSGKDKEIPTNELFMLMVLIYAV